MHTTLLNNRLMELSDDLRSCLGSYVLAQSVHGEVTRLRFFRLRLTTCSSVVVVLECH